MEATERLGGHYSPNLNPKCTHLVVQISLGLWMYCFCILELTMHAPTFNPVFILLLRLLYEYGI